MQILNAPLVFLPRIFRYHSALKDVTRKSWPVSRGFAANGTCKDPVNNCRDFTKNQIIFEMMLANTTLQHLLRTITKVACQ